MATNLISVENASLDFGKGPVLDGVALGLASGQRVGIVGRNGGGKTTLLSVLARGQLPDSGRVTHAGGLRLGWLSQVDSLSDDLTGQQAIFGEVDKHVWASNPQVRETLDELIGGVDSELLARKLGQMSGGQRRRISLARLLVTELDVLLLDEPTNHLDVEGVAWLARTLKQRTQMAVAVVTHDRWFLDEISDRMWEVVDGRVEEYDGGYSAYVLAKAERQRQASAVNARRNNLIRKELAWLRRGAPARTSKPKFRIDVANELIRNEPPIRDSVQLLAFANARLGKSVFEFQDADIAVGGRTVLTHLNWIIGPGQRIGIVGVNGAGKTSILRTLAGELEVQVGKLVRGRTVKLAYLSQHLEELNPKWRVLEAVEQVALRVELGDGRELTATQLAEKLGFAADAQWTPVGDLSGGERRRLQLTRLLMTGPNVLMLDEPTNDFDVETLTALEDLLDSFAGTLIVVSHDRYFLERVCDVQVGLLGNGSVRDLPGGIDEYLALRATQLSASTSTSVGKDSVSDAARARELQKELARLERAIAKRDAEIAALHQEMAVVADDYSKVAALDVKLRELIQAKAELEAAWLEAAE